MNHYPTAADAAVSESSDQGTDGNQSTGVAHTHRAPTIGFLHILLLAVIMVGIGIAIGFELASPKGPGGEPEPKGVACTMDAKLCPDGSAVGRVAPKCEFAPCPTGQAIPPVLDVPVESTGSESGAGQGPLIAPGAGAR